MKSFKENVSSVALGFVYLIVVVPSILLFFWGAGRVLLFLTRIDIYIDPIFDTIGTGIIATTFYTIGTGIVSTMLLALAIFVFCAIIIFSKNAGEEIKKSIKRRND